MLDKGRFSSIQLVILLLMTEGATAFLFAPAGITKFAGPDGWISASILASAYGSLVVLVVVALGNRFPSQAFTEYLPAVLGKIPGKILAALYAGFFIHLSAIILNESSTFVHVAFLRETPPTVLDIVTAAAAAYGVYLGIEVIARQSSIVFPVWALSLLLLLILGIIELNPNNLRPFMENGPLPVLRGAGISTVFRGEAFLLAMLFPYLNQKREALKSGFVNLGVVAIIAGTIMAALVGVFGDSFVTIKLFPFFELARYISVARIVERLEIVVVIIWVAGVIVKLAVFYHSSCIATANTLGLKSYRVTIIPIVAATVIISEMVYPTHAQLIPFLFKPLPPYAATGELLVPALVLLIAVIRNKRESRQS